jgi:hypothetical protein
VKRVLLIGAAMILLLSVFKLYSQQKNQSLPRVVSAGIPLYPPFARVASIQGVVALRVSTDGKHVVTFNSESGPPLLLQASKENVKTWEFEPHQPTSFDVRFIYKLSPSPPCETEFDRSDPKNQSVLLQLPINVELTSVMARDCDPAVTIEEKK